MPISNDGIIKSANYIMSKLGSVESPIVVSFIIVGVICLILLYAFGEKIKELNKKTMYKVFVSISIIVVVAIFIHDTLLLKSMDKGVMIPYANTNQISPDTINPINGGMTNTKNTLISDSMSRGSVAEVRNGEFNSLTDSTFDEKYGVHTSTELPGL